jgi:hypothetical protein
VRLKPEFFHSNMWLDGRRFSRQEAWLDLVGCFESGELEQGQEVAYFPARWNWSVDEIDLFIRQLVQLGWWHQGRSAPSAKAVGVKREDFQTKESIQLVHDLYNQRFGRKLKLTSGRKRAYQRLFDAGLEGGRDAFMKVCDAVLKSGWHMSKLTYQDPISLFRSEERCEMWLLSSLEADESVTDEQLRERLRYSSMVEPAEEPDLHICQARLKELYKQLSLEEQESLKREYEMERDHWVRRLNAGGPSGVSIKDCESGLWEKMVVSATGYTVG